MSTTIPTFEDTRAAAAERFPDPELNAYHLDSIAALMGARARWDGAADLLDEIMVEVNAARAAGVPTPSEPHSLGYWRRIADAYSIEHDGPGAEDGCTECGEPTGDNEGYDGLCGQCADRAEVEGRWQ
ncbi:hypothetical protein [Leifsonia shinshuensis]